MNYRTIIENKILFAILILLVFPITGIVDSFAELPTGPIEITIENVTINSPAKESSGDPVVSEIITQAIIIVGGIVGGGAALAYKIIESRKMPTTLEQDKIFNETAKEAYYQSYLPSWRKIWEIIHSKSNEQEVDDFIKYLWEHYFGKRQIPTESGLAQIAAAQNLPDLQPPAPKTPEDAKNDMIDYVMEKADKFNLNSIRNEKEFVEKKLQHLFNSADVKYYNYITTSLPKFVERAVLATDDIQRNLKVTSQIKEWEENALKELKRLMIFAFLREDTKVLEIMIKSEINKLVSKRLKPARKPGNAGTTKTKKSIKKKN